MRGQVVPCRLAPLMAGAVVVDYPRKETIAGSRCTEAHAQGSPASPWASPAFTFIYELAPWDGSDESEADTSLGDSGMTPATLAMVFPWIPFVGGVVALAAMAIGLFQRGAGIANAGIVLDEIATAIVLAPLPVCGSLAGGQPHDVEPIMQGREPHTLVGMAAERGRRPPLDNARSAIAFLDNYRLRRRRQPRVPAAGGPTRDPCRLHFQPRERSGFFPTCLSGFSTAAAFEVINRAGY